MANLKDIANGIIPSFYKKYAIQLIEFSNWVQDFLSKPNENLGRSGAVCPFTKQASQKNLFKVVVYGKQQPSQEDIKRLLYKLKKLFLKINPLSGKDKAFKTITVLFPNLKEQQYNSVIDQIQIELKKEFVSEGLMIGQFHSNCEQGGLHNKNFRPLKSPLPLLAIRNMVETDWPFLVNNELFENAYAKVFGHEQVNKMKQFSLTH